MNTNQISQFCTVVEAGTLANAANLVHLSAGALSRSMKTLEEEVGFPLLARSGRNVVITERGKLFYVQSKRFLEDLSASVSSIRELGKEAPSTLRVGSFEVFTSHFLGTFIEKYFSGHSFEVYELTPGHMERAVLDGAIDYCITYIPIPHSGLEMTKIGLFQMRAFARRGAFQKMSFSTIPFAVPVSSIPANPMHFESLDTWPKSIPRFEKYRFQLLESILDACTRGLAAAYLPDFLVTLIGQKKLDLVELSAPQGVKAKPLTVYLINKVGRLQAEHKAVIRGMRSILHQG